VLNLLQNTSLTAILFHLYRELGSEGEIDVSRLAITEDTGMRWRITRTRLVIAGVLGIMISITVGIFVIQSIPLEDQVAVTAHRGSSKAAPENTLASIRQAIKEGADWVEIDVQETANGKVVVFHDSDFMKLAGVNTKVWDVTMPELKNIDVGSRFTPEFAGERVPTLAEVLDVCKGKVGVNIELKYYGHDQQLEKRVAEIVEKHEMVSEIVIMSLKLDAIKKMKALRPTWTVGLLMSVSAGDLANADVDFLAVNAGFVNRDFVRAAHSGGKEVYVWTVNDAATMSTMISRGVDNLITDKPALARAVIAQRMQMNPFERLLLELAGIFGTIPEIGEQ
jgi:glycerophosphoryl diester phosphodiesterase